MEAEQLAVVTAGILGEFNRSSLSIATENFPLLSIENFSL